ncbi:hypothetical protein [Treponema endosymbiont of Eucomonympha sp.]|uniref:hypothetical protein n=1 Tax=Treponema endosymbiont of Eucomonympha sp. TaxID=1580831 RepID=UPI00078080B4|nr:hypothetical protein [Treponema endosymbiont of Eucomonympha sp.]
MTNTQVPLWAGSMAVIMASVFLLLVTALLLVAQFWLIKKHKIFGSILPLLCFLFSLVCLLVMPTLLKESTSGGEMPKTDGGTQKAWGGFFLANIPTIILLTPYLPVKRKSDA